jgi:dihydrolipoamide dehydrogenase
MSDRYDVIIIGAGTAGLSALSEVRKRTDSFLLVNEGPYGTTCARVGCMPSKSLIEVADTFHALHRAGDLGVLTGRVPSVDGRRVMERVRRLRDDFVAGARRATEGLGEANVRGHARIIGPHTVEIEGRRVEAGALVVAAGSSPVVPPGWRGIGGVLTSDEVFEMEDLPRSMAVVGLGPVGLELAQAFSRLGVEVHGFDASNTLARISDPGVLRAAMDSLGSELALRLRTGVEAGEDGDGVRLSWDGGRITVDRVLLAVGRRPRTEGLGLENLGTDLDGRGLPPFDAATMRVADTRVFIAGDVNARAPILHEAADDGRIAGFNAVREEPAEFCRRAPMSVVFTQPCIASVGSPGPGDGVVSGGQDYSRQSRARMSGRAAGHLKVWARSGDGLLLGAEMCVPGGEHLAHLLAWALQRGLTAGEMLELPYYHPTLEEGLRSAVRRAAAEAGSRRRSELPPCGSLPTGE